MLPPISATVSVDPPILWTDSSDLSSSLSPGTLSSAPSTPLVCLLCTFLTSLFAFFVVNRRFPVQLKPIKLRYFNVDDSDDSTTSTTTTEHLQFAEWKWRNISVSLIHSLISGLSALYLSYQHYHYRSFTTLSLDHPHHQHLNQHPQHTLLSYGRHLIAFSLGYFFYDTWLSVSKLGRYPGRGEIIFHHVITTATLALVLLCRFRPFSTFVPLTVLGLVIEFNNVFIHIRALLDLADNKTASVYRINSVLVLATVIAFRFVPLHWILTTVSTHPRLSHWTAIAICAPIAIILAISLVIFYRLWREDFCRLVRFEQSPNSSSSSTTRSQQQSLSTSNKTHSD